MPDETKSKRMDLGAKEKAAWVDFMDKVKAFASALQAEDRKKASKVAADMTSALKTYKELSLQRMKVGK